MFKQVSEKESGVRQAMSTMGLLDTPFWLTWGIFEGALVSVSLALLSIIYSPLQECRAQCVAPERFEALCWLHNLP